MLWDNSPDSLDSCHCASGQCCCCNDICEKNIQDLMGSPMKQDNDLSLYENTSPISVGTTSRCVHKNKRRRPLGDVDNNSQDSAYDSSCSGQFFSPNKRSFCSTGSMDDFLDICSLDDNDENAQLPGDFNKLISCSISATYKKSPEHFIRQPYRRALSLTTPTSTKARSCLFKKDDEIRPFKRPEPPVDVSPRNAKRCKTFDPVKDMNISPPVKLVRSLSLTATEDSIMSALQRSSTEPDLIGDFSKQFCLPLTMGKHADLKSITPSTLASLVRGDYDQNVKSYKVVDCRFPYEYEGGHIYGAINLYTKQQIMEELLKAKLTDNVVEEQVIPGRHILVFHCEFSSERGPNLSRFLRQVDRSHNKNCYPNLHYPEIYLLDGGYKKFYEQFSELCIPDGYLPMLHPSYEQDLRFFRSKSKTFNSDNRSKSSIRSLAFKRL